MKVKTNQLYQNFLPAYSKHTRAMLEQKILTTSICKGFSPASLSSIFSIILDTKNEQVMLLMNLK
jgi:hypothetical protein